MRPAWTVLALCAARAAAGDWSPQRAADYLDARQKEWLAWKPANGPNGTCISCHTNSPFLLARPILRKALREKQPTSYESALIAALESRLKMREAKEYSASAEPRASQAFGVESVHAGLFLTLQRRPGWEQALERMWSLQIRDGQARGAWNWFDLDLNPWEVPESRYYGATLAAMAAGSAPKEYRKRPAVRDRVAELKEYLARDRSAQPLHNRLMLLWASASLPGLLDGSERKAIAAEALARQAADGSWSLDAIGPFKKPFPQPSNYATALAVYTLRQAGVRDPRLGRARAWLQSRQDKTSGDWSEESMNKTYPPDSMQVKFMRDAATAFAVLALLD